MTPRTRDLVQTGLDQWLTQRICKLVEVLSSADTGDVEAMARYLRGEEKAIALHEELVNELDDTEQPAP